MKTTIIGLIGSIGIIAVIIATKQDLEYFWNWQALLLTLGGTIAATITYFSAQALKFSLDVIGKLVSKKRKNPYNLVELIVKISKATRSKDMLEILEENEFNDNQFLKKGLILVADNVDALHIKEILTRQSQALTAQYRIAERVFAVSGSFAPMFGMLGTVMGLIAMLGRIQTPDMIPPAMGLALVTTMYGLILAVAFFIPISGKIRDINHFETDYRELAIEGILAIYSQDSPMIIRERLMSFLKPWNVKYEK